MADARVFITIIVLVIYVESTPLSGKGLLCRDPDTGKLHTVNTTWSSTSFCGNYTCRQRRLNTTETQYAKSETPIREFNVTIAIRNNKPENKTDITEPVEVTDIKARITEEIEQKNGVNPNDRYLTENEIKTISKFLHTVKKSDIDAVVDIYNLAQEIYDEMDKAPDQSAVDEVINNVKEKLGDTHLKRDDLNIKPSIYWYDRKPKTEMATQTSNIVPTSATKSKQQMPTYFKLNGPLTQKDFEKIPYYYPISSFQRMATYVHQPQTNKPIQYEKPPCQKEKAVQKAVNTKDSLKLIKPSHLLPYPFANVHNYNMTKYPNMYYSNPWVWDYYYRNRQSNPYFKAYIAQIPNAVLVNSHLSGQVHDIEQKPVKVQPEEQERFANQMFEQHLMPDWKTEPLSNKVINEVKANLDTSQLIKAFPLRRKVKVEKVGKVIKMDEVTRLKRDVENGTLEGEYEAVIERVTCETKTEPGYFRYGNLTQPFPHCCPQLVLNR